ncbi:MAG: hypothetical protein Q7V31_12080 [Parvibaculum sp.]|uniref:capsid assembly protein n=1 Tax=Parvibaculum sp. TaxID=2024848 RepID=UPI00271A51A3|nr:hypothetical protein [Parvibaculum sp.]MDO8839655.1 hypothetical protein [Parvibaculum sp.]
MTTAVFGAAPTTSEAPVAAPAVDRPEWLPEQFDKPEALADAYAALRAKMDGKAPDADPAKPDTDPAKPDAVPPVETPNDAAKLHDAASRVLADVGLDLAAYNAEFAETGALSDATYSALEAKGFDRATVDAYKNAMTAGPAAAQTIADAESASIIAAAGGQEKFTEILAWASETLTADERSAYDAMIESGNAKTARMAVEWLSSKHANSDSNTPNLVHGADTNTPTVQPFGSMQEVTRAMSDARYKSGDKAYHADVQKRLAVSHNLR